MSGWWEGHRQPDGTPPRRASAGWVLKGGGRASSICGRSAALSAPGPPPGDCGAENRRTQSEASDRPEHQRLQGEDKDGVKGVAEIGEETELRRQPEELLGPGRRTQRPERLPPEPRHLADASSQPLQTAEGCQSVCLPCPAPVC